MIVRRVEELVENEVLARTLTTWDYQTILPEGAVIRVEYIEKLKDLRIREVCIHEEGENQVVEKVYDVK